jgi:phospholipid/cholesterol/gamma-HCH transport system substrate-binding protein
MIPMERTSVPVEQDELFRSLQDYFGNLDPEKVADFVTTVAKVLKNNGEELNELIHTGSSVIGTLSDKRDTLAELISNFNELTNTLLTRQDTIARVIKSYNEVATVLTNNRDALEGTITGLNEASVQLASLLIDHQDPLGSDIDALTKTARTLKVNVDRFVRTGHWANRLFTAASNAVDYERQWLRLGNQGEPLVELLEYRLRDRLIGVCLRLNIEDCQTPAYWADAMPSLFCFEDSCPQTEGPQRKSVGQQLEEALEELPGESGDKIRKELGLKKNCKKAKNPKRCRERKQELDPSNLIDDLIDEAEETVDDPLDGIGGAV